jgi:DNA-directed RNA polymerase specialized sigma24 family protein
VQVPLLVPLPKEDELFDPNDPVEVCNWLVGKLSLKVSVPTAEDLSQRAVTEALPGGKRPWKEEDGLTLAVHLAYRVHNLHLGNVRRRGYRPEEGRPDEDAGPTSSPSPESAVDRKDRHTRLDAAATAEFANSPKVQPVLEMMMRGDLCSYEEYARRTGLTVEQARNAKERVRKFIMEWCEREDREEAEA